MHNSTYCKAVPLCVPCSVQKVCNSMQISSVLKTLVTRTLIRGLSADIDIALRDVALFVAFPHT